ncbi:MAG TPA: hypothetical protein VEQ11_02520 [Chloroflexota bacterium]|nr:hypothetical protein [Chloroflexota bacterium]
MPPAVDPGRAWVRPAAWLLLMVLVAAPTMAGAASQDAGGPSGLLLLPRNGQLSVADATTGEERALRLGGSGLVVDVAWSPDRSRFVASRFIRRPEDSVVGVGRDIQVFPAEGGEPLLTIERDGPRVLLGAPAWARDGQSLYFERQDAMRPPSEGRIDQAALDSSWRRTVVARANGPAVGPDGSVLLYVRPGDTDSLVAMRLEDEAYRTVVPENKFLGIAYPRFSPDGSWIAFVAAGEPIFSERVRFGVLAWVPSASPAGRHGLPWDVWLVRPDGSDLRRLTDFGQDDPSLAWSPDGRWLALYGAGALYVLNASIPAQAIPIGLGGYGGIDWGP